MFTTRSITRMTAAVLLLCSSPLLAGPLYYDAREAKLTLRLHGVVYRPDGKPLGKGRVYLRTSYNDLEAVQTDGKGRYSCEARVKDLLFVEAYAEGLGYSKGLTAPLPNGAHSIVLDIPLKPIPVMAGRVFLPDGAPATNLGFEAGGEMERDLGYGAGGTCGNKVLAFRTDAAGRYREPLLPGPGRATALDGDGTEYHLYLTSPYGWAGPIDVAVRLDKPQVVRDIHLRAGDRVAGTVICYPEAEPLAGVEVRAVRSSMMHGVQDLGHAVSDENGQFQIANHLPPGQYEIWARGKDLFVVGAKGQPLAATHDGAVVNVTVNMTRPLRVEGTIYGPDGKPASNARVENWRRRTDSNGHYVYEYERQGMDGMYGTPLHCPRYVTLAPRVKDFGVAAPAVVDILSPWPDKLDFQLQKPGSISGKVVGEDGKCPPWCWPVLTSLAEHPLPAEQWQYGIMWDEDNSKSYLNDQGNFSFAGVVPGAYRLGVRGGTIHELTVANGQAPTYTVTAGQSLGPLTIAVTYKPRLYAELSGLPERQSVSGGPLPLEVYCVLRPSDSREPLRQGYVHQELGDRYVAWSTAYGAGRFDIVFHAACGSDRRVSQIIRGVELSEGPLTGPLDFSLTLGGSVGGRVLAADGKHRLGGLDIVLVPLSGDAMLLGARNEWGGDYAPPEMYAITDEQGRFTISGLLPGEYQITPLWSPLRYGARQTKTVSLKQDQKITNLIFRETSSWP